MQFAEPWETITDERYRQRIEAELATETAGRPAHPLAEAHLLARRIDQDDFLFKTSNAQWPYAIVHLTFSGRAEAAPWPITRQFADIGAVQAALDEPAASY